MFTKTSLIAAVTLGAIFYSPPADANMILSVFHGAVFYLVASLIPVIVVEAIVLSVQFSLQAGHAAVISLFANIASTLVGIPVVGWLLATLRASPLG